MTRHLRSSSSLDDAARLLLQPLAPARSLTNEVADRIAANIRAGQFAPGAQLPTEAALMSAMNVSRTVIREAVATLKADGLVVTRQGLGAFVAPDASRTAFRIPAHSTGGLQPLGSVLHVMELRMAVELEAAALAAARRSIAQLARITAALRAIDSAIEDGQTAVQEDFALHFAIAEGTNNTHFSEFLSFLGRHVIPRQVVRANAESGSERRDYLIAIQREHERIVEAIAGSDPSGARKAMRLHLAKSITRYRRLAAAEAP